MSEQLPVVRFSEGGRWFSAWWGATTAVAACSKLSSLALAQWKREQNKFHGFEKWRDLNRLTEIGSLLQYQENLKKLKFKVAKTWRQLTTDNNLFYHIVARYRTVRRTGEKELKDDYCQAVHANCSTFFWLLRQLARRDPWCTACVCRQRVPREHRSNMFCMFLFFA